MSLSDEFGKAADIAARSEVVKARRERDSAVSEAIRLKEQLEQAQRALDVIESVEGASLAPPVWLAPAKPKRTAAMLMVMLSDTHFDEVVLPDEVDGLNAYNRQIAVLRLQKWTESVIKLARHYLAGMDYDGITVLLGGDIFSATFTRNWHKRTRIRCSVLCCSGVSSWLRLWICWRPSSSVAMSHR